MKNFTKPPFWGMLIFLEFFLSPLFAQVGYIKGGTLKYPSDAKTFYVTFSKDKKSIGYFVFSKKEQKIKFYPLDQNLEIKEEVKFNLSKLPKNAYELIKITTAGNNTYWLYSLWDRPSESEKIFLLELDFENKKLSPEPRLVLESSKLKYASNFKFFDSSDSSKQLITYQLEPGEKNEKLSYGTYGIHVFDKSFNKIWGKEFRLPYTESQIELVEYEVTNKGEVHVVVKLKKEKIAGQKGKEPPTFEVFKYNAKDNNPKVFKFEGEKNYFNDIYVYESPTGEISFIGHYGKSRDVFSIAGLFYYQWDEKKSVFKKFFYDFPNELILKYSKKFKEVESKNDYDLTDVVVTDVIPAKSGGFYILSEVRYYEIVNGNTGSYSAYHYDDVFVSKIAKDGKLEWMNKVPKRQSTGGFPIGGCSYNAQEIENMLHIYYADNVSNNELKEDKAPNLHADGFGGVLIDASFNPKSGALDRKVMLNYKDEKVTFLLLRDFTPYQKNSLVGISGTGFKRFLLQFQLK